MFAFLVGLPILLLIAVCYLIKSAAKKVETKDRERYVPDYEFERYTNNFNPHGKTLGQVINHFGTTIKSVTLCDKNGKIIHDMPIALKPYEIQPETLKRTVDNITYKTTGETTWELYCKANKEGKNPYEAERIAKQNYPAITVNLNIDIPYLPEETGLQGWEYRRKQNKWH